MINGRARAARSRGPGAVGLPEWAVGRARADTPRMREPRGQSPIEGSISAFLAHLRIECGLAQNTLEAYGRDLRDLAADLAADGIDSAAGVTFPRLVEHMAGLKRDRELASSSIARRLAAIRMLFRWLAAEGKIAENPTALLERPTLWRRLPGVLSPQTVRALLAAPKPPEHGEEGPGPPLWIRDRALLELLYACGLRASEAATVRAGDVYPKLGVVKVTGKGDKQRLVPFGRPAEAAIERYAKECRPLLMREDGRDGGALLLSRSGRPLERVAVWQIVKKHARAAGISHAYPHLIRHSFATHLLAGGADLRVVQELLGHADITTTQVYTHVDQSRLRRVLEMYHPKA